MDAEKLSEHKPRSVDDNSCNLIDLHKSGLFLRILGSNAEEV